MSNNIGSFLGFPDQADIKPGRFSGNFDLAALVFCLELRVIE